MNILLLVKVKEEKNNNKIFLKKINIILENKLIEYIENCILYDNEKTNDKINEKDNYMEIYNNILYPRQEKIKNEKLEKYYVEYNKILNTVQKKYLSIF
jgi:hypothetical protein